MDISSNDQGVAQEQSSDNLEKYGQIEIGATQRNNPRGNIWYLPIIGHIEGHITMPPGHKTTKYEHIIPMLLDAADNQNIHGLLVVLNTVGGDVEAGLAIAELISHFTKPTVSLVLGGGHSIGVPLAVSAKHSFIASSAAMTIHPVRMNGTMVGAQQTYDYFEKMQDRVLDFVTKNSNIKKTRLKELMMDTSTMAMDIGTFLIGEEAVKEGLINEIGGLSGAMEKLYEMIEEQSENS